MAEGLFSISGIKRAFNSLTTVKGKSNDSRAIDISNFPSFMSLNTKAGVSVSPASSLTYSAVFACVDLIASTISTIPVNIFEETKDGKFSAINHDQFYLIKKEPHPMYSKVQWTKLMVVHYLLWGDGISVINRDKMGRPESYSLQMPWDWSVEIIKDIKTGKKSKWHKICGVLYPDSDIIQWSDLSIDGLKGCGRVEQHKETIGLGLAMRDYGNSLMANGGKVMGYIHGERNMTPDAYKLISEKFLTGYGNDNGVGVLPHGWKYEPFKHPMPPASAEWLGGKKYTVEEVCTIFRTAPILIGSSGGVNNSVAESVIRTWLMTTIAPIVTMIEFEWDRKIFRTKERNTYYVKYNLWSLDKADILKTMDALVKGVNNGLYNKDEARAILERNKLPNGLGQDFYQPLNLAPVEDAKEYFKQEKTTYND